MTLDEIKGQLLRMPSLSGKQSRHYICSQRTYDELCEKVQPQQGLTFDGLSFLGVRISVHPFMQDGKFYPEDFLSVLDPIVPKQKNGPESEALSRL